MSRDLRFRNYWRGHEKVDSATPAAPRLVRPCGKSVEQMRRDTEAFLSRVYGREVKIVARSHA